MLSGYQGAFPRIPPRNSCILRLTCKGDQPHKVKSGCANIWILVLFDDDPAVRRSCRSTNEWFALRVSSSRVLAGESGIADCEISDCRLQISHSDHSTFEPVPRKVVLGFWFWVNNLDNAGLLAFLFLSFALLKLGPFAIMNALRFNTARSYAAC
jgi:hypothetical protein